MDSGSDLRAPGRGLALRLGRRLWHSPTATTWVSFATRYAVGLVVLPVALVKLSTAEIAVWLLLRSVIALQGVGDLGFTPTFARVIAFAMGGASDLRRVGDPGSEVPPASAAPNWRAVSAICRTMRTIYTRVAAAAVVVLGAGVTWAFREPIGHLADPGAGWVAWGAVVLATGVSLRGNTYNAFLQGVNEIPLLRRWEALTNAGAVLTSLTVLLLGWWLLALVVAEQAWRALAVLRNRFLCRRVHEGRYFRVEGRELDTEVFAAVWPAAWRSGLGTLMSTGVVEASGFLYAQVGSPAALATYLLALRLIRLLGGLSQAPFYSRLPLLAKLLAEGDRTRLRATAERGMRLSYWSFALPFVAAGLAGEPLLRWIGSNAPFPDPLLWLGLGAAMFIERYGAMHIQLFSTTNRIIWHTANGVAGLIFLLASLALLDPLGVYAFPVALLLAYGGFYGWYSARHSYAAFGLDLRRFEGQTSLGPALVVVVYAAGVLFFALAG